MASAGPSSRQAGVCDQRGRAAHQPREQRRVVRRHRRHDPVAAVPGAGVPVGHRRQPARVTLQPAEPERRAVQRHPQRVRHPPAGQPGPDTAGQVRRQPPRDQAGHGHARHQHHDRDHRHTQPERIRRTQPGRRERHRQAHHPGNHRRQRRTYLHQKPASPAGTLPAGLSGGFGVARQRLMLSGNFLHDSIRGNAHLDFIRRRAETTPPTSARRYHSIPWYGAGDRATRRVTSWPR